MISLVEITVEGLDQQLPMLTGGSLVDASAATSSADQAHAATRRRHCDRRRALAARAALRLAAVQHRGEPAASAPLLEVTRRCATCGGPHGPPELSGTSLGSSSSADVVLAGATGPECALGVDVERIPRRLFPGFDEYALDARERRALPEGGPQRLRSLVVSWVTKEAVLKAARVGLEHPPDQLTLGSADRRSRWFGVHRAEPLVWRQAVSRLEPGIDSFWAAQLPAPPGYVAAVACRAPQDVQVRPPSESPPGRFVRARARAGASAGCGCP